MDDLLSLTNSLKDEITFQNDLTRRAPSAAEVSEEGGGGGGDDEEPSWLTEASDAVAASDIACAMASTAASAAR